MKLQELNEAVHSSMLQTEKEVDNWLKKYKIEEYIINDDLSVDVGGEVDISNMNLKYIPVQFNKVAGDFRCKHMNLRTLKGTPRKVGEDFECYKNQLVTLEGGPQVVGGTYDCSFNLLTSLKGVPNVVERLFDCTANRLQSLEGGLHTVKGMIICKDNEIQTLHNIHRHVRVLTGELIIENIVQSHILGLMRIRGLESVDFDEGTHQVSSERLHNALNIINANLQGKGNIHTVQEQLLDAGLEEYAQL